MSTYTLSAENEKLEIRAKTFDRQSRLFLDRFIRPGQKILEIGCGMGGATRMIASRLDNTGFIYALDMNPTYVKYVEKKLTSDGFQNFSVQQQNIESLHEETKYDVIYGRAILHHVPHAKNIIKNLLGALKPGGLMAFEEPIMDTGFAQPEVNDFPKLFEWYMRLGKSKNCDYLIGKHLGLYFQVLGLKILESQLIQISVRNPLERDAFLELVNTLEGQLVDSNIATHDDIQKVKQSLKKMVEADHIFYPPTFCQILGQKQEGRGSSLDN